MEEPKEKSRLWKSDSLLTLDFRLKNKYSDFSNNNKKDDYNIGNGIGGEWHYPKGIGNNQVDRTADAKVPSNIFEKVHIEEKSSIHKEEEVAGLPTWKQEILTEKVVKVVLQLREELIHLDVPKKGWQVTLAEKRDANFSFIQEKSSTSYDFESSSLHLQ